MVTLYNNKIVFTMQIQYGLPMGGPALKKCFWDTDAKISRSSTEK